MAMSSIPTEIKQLFLREVVQNMFGKPLAKLTEKEKEIWHLQRKYMQLQYSDKAIYYRGIKIFDPNLTEKAQLLSNKTVAPAPDTIPLLEGYINFKTSVDYNIGQLQSLVQKMFFVAKNRSDLLALVPENLRGKLLDYDLYDQVYANETMTLTQVQVDAFQQAMQPTFDKLIAADFLYQIVG